MRDESRERQLADQPLPDSDPRISIWTIRAKWIGWFYLLFTLHATPLIYALWWSENYGSAHDNIASTITAIVSGSASLIFVAAVATIIELEAVMVLKTLLERHFEKKDREKAEKTEQRIRKAYEKGRQDERAAQSASRDASNGNQED